MTKLGFNNQFLNFVHFSFYQAQSQPQKFIDRIGITPMKCTAYHWGRP